MLYNGGVKGMFQKGEDLIMPTKELVKEEIIAASDLRTFSQKTLLQMAENFDKLGVISNNHLALALMSWGKYEQIVDQIKLLSNKIEEYENLLEDIELAKQYNDRVMDVEEGRVSSIAVDSLDDVFELIEDK